MFLFLRFFPCSAACSDGFFFAVKEVSLIDPGNQQSLLQLEQVLVGHFTA